MIGGERERVSTLGRQWQRACPVQSSVPRRKSRKSVKERTRSWQRERLSRISIARWFLSVIRAHIVTSCYVVEKACRRATIEVEDIQQTSRMRSSMM